MCPNWSAAKIQIHLNKAQLDRNIYHFNYTNYYLFNANYASFNKIYNLVSKINFFQKLTFKTLNFGCISVGTWCRIPVLFTGTKFLSLYARLLPNHMKAVNAYCSRMLGIWRHDWRVYVISSVLTQSCICPIMKGRLANFVRVYCCRWYLFAHSREYNSQHHLLDSRLSVPVLRRSQSSIHSPVMLSAAPPSSVACIEACCSYLLMHIYCRLLLCPCNPHACSTAWLG